MSLINDIRRSALNLLARREHSETELYRKLRLKKYPDPEIKTVLSQLIQENLLSNTRFIENYIHYRQNRGYGPNHIRSELLERGILESVIEHHLNIADNAWFLHARTAWQKRFKNQIPRDFKTRAKQMRFLQYRGFTAEQIEYVFQDSD